jgi:hypothetical protein
MTGDREAVLNTGRYIRGRVEGDKLTRALIDAASRGQRPNCGDVEIHRWWTSEHDSERALAALRCHGCVVFDPCGEAAEARQEVWGVWASKDHSRRPGRAKPRPEEECA